MQISFTPRAQREMDGFSKDIRNRILTKIHWYASQPLPLRFAKRLSGPLAAYSRFRIGEYRVIVNSDGKILHIVRVIKRSEAYS